MDALRTEFRSSLADLTFNSKPIITTLTIIAQESSQYAPTIVQAIHDHLRVAHPKHQIPALYLLDSILKNVGGVYISEFAKNIVRTFKNSFELCVPEDRARMKRLLDTWKAYPKGPIFPADALREMEKIVAPKPYFLFNIRLSNHHEPKPTGSQNTVPSMNPTNIFISQQIQILLDRKKVLAQLNPLDSTHQVHIQILNQLMNLVQTTVIDVSSSLQITQQLQQISSSIPNVPSAAVNIPTTPIAAGSSAPQMSPTSLVSNLMKYGLISKPATRITDMSQLPPLTFSDLTRKRPEAVFLLYDALELQCKQCGIRSRLSEENKKRMDAHLDWHFRQNRRAKERGKNPVARNWFVSKQDWIEEKEVVVADQLVPFQEALVETEVTNDNESHDIQFIPNEADTVCLICHESFEKYWSDDHEDWMLRNAIRMDLKLFHYTCYNGVIKNRKSAEPIATGSPSLKRKTPDDGLEESHEKRPLLSSE